MNYIGYTLSSPPNHTEYLANGISNKSYERVSIKEEQVLCYTNSYIYFRRGMHVCLCD